MGFEMFKSGKLHFSKLEVEVVRCLAERKNRPLSNNLTELSEITQTTAAKGEVTRDQDEVLRALYTLEGKGLVSPEPAGDFTSNKWKITEIGLGTLEVIEASLAPKRAA